MFLLKKNVCNGTLFFCFSLSARIHRFCVWRIAALSFFRIARFWRDSFGDVMCWVVVDRDSLRHLSVEGMFVLYVMSVVERFCCVFFLCLHARTSSVLEGSPLWVSSRAQGFRLIALATTLCRCRSRFFKTFIGRRNVCTVFFCC
jgi:hypothetical protein